MPTFRESLTGNGNSNDRPSSGQGGGYRSAFAEVLGSNGDRSMQDGGITPEFRNSYSAISEEDRRSRINGDREEEERPRREMSAFERGLYDISAAADDIMETASFDADFSDILTNPVSTLGGLAANTFVSQFTGLPSGMRSLYEGWTGHNVRDADREAGILGEDLNSNQKVGATLSGIIDTAGVAVGGSEEFLSGAYNLLRGRAANAAERAARYGVGEFLKDAASEGIEEGVQSLAEDVRNDVEFDPGRALESAAWGAIGGGMMSGAGYALNRIAGGGHDVTGSQDSARADQPTGENYFSFGDSVDLRRDADTQMAQFYEDDLKADNTAAGSTSYTGIPGGYGIKPIEIDAGVRQLRAMYLRDDASADAFVRSTQGSANPVDRKTADQWFNDLDDASLARTINAAIGSGTVFELAAKRDPKTKDSSLIKFMLRMVNDGGGIQFNPAVPQAFGADLDGDTWRIHFDDPQVSTAKWVTEYLMSPRPLPDSDGQSGRYGSPNIDMKYSGMMIFEKDDDGSYRVNDHAKSAFEKVYGRYQYNRNPIGRGRDNRVRPASDWLKLFDEYASRSNAADGDSDTESVMLLNRIRNDFADLVGSDTADRFTSDLIQQLQYDTHLDVELAAVISRTSAMPPAERAAIESAGVKLAQSSGSTGGKSSVMSMLRWMGKVTEAFSDKENSALRTDQSIQWDTGSLVTLLAGSEYKLPAVQEMVAWQMHVIEAGLAPYDAVNAKFNAYLFQSLMDEGLIVQDSPSIQDGVRTWDEFKQGFIKVYNGLASEFNEAMKQLGYDGRFKDPASISKAELESDKGISVSRALEDSLGFLPVSQFLRTDGSDATVDSMPLSDFISMQAESIDGSAGNFTMDEQADIAVRDMVRWHNSITDAKSNRIENMISGLVSDRLRQNLTVSFDADGNPIYDEDRLVAYEQYASAIRSIIGLKASAYFGFSDTDRMMRTSWGRYLFSDNPDEVVRAVGAIEVAFKYRSYIEARIKISQLRSEMKAEKDKKKRGKYAADIIALKEKAMSCVANNWGLGLLDRMISEQIMLDSDSIDDSLLRTIIDPGSIGWNELNQQWEENWRAVVGTDSKPENLLFDMMRTNEGEIGDGEIALRARDAKRYQTAMQSYSMEYAHRIWTNIFDIATKSGNRRNTVANALTQIIRSNIVYQNLQIKSAAICDVTYVMHDTAAKGTSPYSAGCDYLQQAISRDSVEDFVHKLTGQSMGSWTKDDATKSTSLICRLLSDGSAQITVDDTESSTFYSVTRQDIFASVGRTVKPGDDPSFSDYDALFSKYPQLVTVVTPRTFRPVPSSSASVTQVMNESLDSAVKDYIGAEAGDAALQRKMDASKVLAHLMNSPKFEAVIIGTVAESARRRYGSFDEMLSRPNAFSREVESAYRTWANVLYHLATSSSFDDIDALKSELRRSLSKRYADTIEDSLDIMSSIARSLRSGTEALESEYVREAVNDLRKNQYISELSKRCGVEFTGTGTDSDPGQIYTGVDRFNEIISIVDMLSGMERERLESVATLAKGEIEKMRVDYQTAHSGDSDPIGDFNRIVEQLNGEQIFDFYISDTTRSRIIHESDIMNQSADEMYRKITKIAKSGEYALPQAAEIISREDLDELFSRKANGKADAIRRIQVIANKWNSLIIDRAILDYSMEIGVDSSVSGFMASTEATSEILDMLDEVRGLDLYFASDESMKKLGYPNIPDMYFADPTVTAYCNHAQTIAESSGNSTNSGIEGGGYQRLIGVAAINQSAFGSGSKFEPTAETIGIGELMRRIKAPVETGHVVNPYLHCRISYVDRKSNKVVRIDNVDIDVLATIARSNGTNTEIMVYSLENCAHGLGIATRTGIEGAGRDFVYLKQMLMDFVYELSEGHVFKKKKALNMFESIVREVAEKNVSGRSLNRPSSQDAATRRDDLRQQLNAFRNEVASHFYSEISGEQLSKTFSKYDALVLTQFVNPFVRVSNADGSISINMPSDAFYSDARFAEFESDMSKVGLSWDQVTTISPHVMSITAISDRINRYIGSQTSELRDNEKQPTRDDLATWAENALTDWSGYRYDSDGVSDLLSSVTPLSMRTPTNMPIAGRATAMMNLMRIHGESPRMSGVKSPADSNVREFFSDSRFKNMVRFRNSYLPKNSNFMIAWADVDGDYMESMRKGGNEIRMMSNALGALGLDEIKNVSSTDTPLALMIMTDDSERIMRDIGIAKRNTAMVVVPSSLASSIETAMDNSGVRFSNKVNMDIGGVSCCVYAPTEILDSLNGAYDGPLTYRRPGSPDEIAIMTGVAATGSSSDSMIMRHPSVSDRQSIRVDADMSFDLDELFPGERVSLEPVTKDDVTRFKREFDKWVAGDKTSLFSVPNYPKQRRLSDKQIEFAVRNYLNRYADMDQSGMLTDGISSGDCFWIAKVNTFKGDAYYAPLIVNTGQSSTSMDGISPSSVNDGDAGRITVNWTGILSPKQFDGLKGAFSTVAWKGYEIEASGEMLDNWPAIKVKVADRKVSDKVFNLNTLESRTIENGTSVLRNNLYWYSRLGSPMSLFFKPDANGKYSIDKSLMVSTADDARLSALVSLSSNTTQYNYASGMFQVFKDPRLDMIVRHVYRKCLQQRVPPILALGNLAKNPVTGKVGTSILFFEPASIYGELRPNQIECLWHAIDGDLVHDPYNIDGSDDGSKATIFDSRGNMLYKSIDGGDPEYRTTIIEPVKYKMDSTMLGMPASTGAFSEQQLTNRAVLNGFQESDMNHVTDMFVLHSGDYRQWERFGSRSRSSTREVEPLGLRNIELKYNDRNGRASLEMKHAEDVRKEGERTFWKRLVITENDGSGDVISYKDGRVRTKLEQLRKALGYEKASDRNLMAIFKLTTGYTYNDGDGSSQVTLHQFQTGIDTAIRLLKSNRFFVQGGADPDSGRISIPIGPKSLMDWVFNSPAVQENFGNDRSRWNELAINEFNKTLDALTTVKPKSKKIAIMRMMEYATISNSDMNIPWTNRYLTGSMTAYDIAHTSNLFMDAYSQNTGGSDMKSAWDERLNAEDDVRKVIDDFASLAASREFDKMESKSSPTGFSAVWLGSQYSGASKVGRTMSTMSRTLSVCDPLLMPSAYVQRRLGSGLTKAMMFLDSRGVKFFGGKSKNSILFERDGEGQAVLKQACKDGNLQRVWNMLNELQLTGSDVAAIRNANDYDDVVSILSSVQNRQGKLGKVSGKIFKMSTMSGRGVNWQLENFFNYVASRLDPDRSPWYFERDADGRTNFEVMLENDPTTLLLDLTIGLDNRTNPDLMLAMRGRNFALESDLAQQQAASLILQEVLANHPLIDFLLTTNVMKFPTYMFNVSNWYLKFVAPVSSLNYWFTDMLIKSGNNRGFLAQGIEKLTGVDIAKLHLERTQTFDSLHQAAVNDALRLSVTAIAGIIASLAFEPPEDEDKWGNINEWTFCGIRLDDVWWLQDILGPSFAIAATWKSAFLGHPRLDLIPNWLGTAMAQNPLLKVGDVAAALFDEQSSPLDGMTSEDDLYKGGNPTAPEMWQAGLVTYMMNWSSQFVLPSFLRSLYTTTGDQYEHSYKRVYMTDAAGNIVTDENGQPITTRTTYLDSRIRYLTRTNPFWAVVCSAFGDSPTGYLRSDMPRTVYYENAQLESMEYYSLYEIDPATGQEVPKPIEERRAIAYEILATLANTSDPAELAATGFMIDYETRAYVSKVLWDIRQYNQNMYNAWVQDTGMDGYIVGNGNLNLGLQRMNAIKEAYWADYNYINELYNRLWDDALSSGPQKYNRYQTTYQQDEWGNWYATGFRNSFMNIGVPGFNTAPGTLSDPGSTMGHDNDWDTESAVMPGVSTGERALIPIDNVFGDVPPIESWAEDGDGGGYSDIAGDSLGDTGNLTGFGDDTGSSTYPSGYRYRRYGGGGGGGGGGYTPNIYSRLPNVYLPSARTMYAERWYDASYDYLRPNFETKGSREAYKRSDI